MRRPLNARETASVEHAYGEAALRAPAHAERESQVAPLRRAAYHLWLTRMTANAGTC